MGVSGFDFSSGAAKERNCAGMLIVQLCAIATAIFVFLPSLPISALTQMLA